MHPDARLFFHDSEVRCVVADIAAGRLVIHFSALRVHDPDAGDEAEGYLSGATLEVSGAHWTGPVPVCIGRLASGAVTIAGVHQATLPLTAELRGPLRLELQFSNGYQLHAEAQALVMRAADARRTDDFAC